jgi:hypothetical protein
MRRLLRAFVCLRSDISYTQGMNFIAGFLLLVMQDEDDAFWTFTAFVDVLFHGYFCEGMPSLTQDMRVFTLALELVAPDVHAQLQAFDLDVTSCVLPRYFLSAFLCSLPFEVAQRIWDCFMLAGAQAPRVAVQVAVALFVLHRSDVLACTSFMQLALLVQVPVLDARRRRCRRCRRCRHCRRCRCCPVIDRVALCACCVNRSPWASACATRAS